MLYTKRYSLLLSSHLAHTHCLHQHLPSNESRGVVNLVGDYAGDADVRGRLHLRLASTGKDLLGLDPTQVKPVVLLDQQKPLAQPAGSKVVTRRVCSLFVLYLLSLFSYCTLVGRD